MTDVAIFHPAIVKDPTRKGIKTYAIWDTRASGSVITVGAARELGLVPTGKVQTQGVNRTKIVDQYTINIGLPNRVMFDTVNVSCTEKLPFECALIIGMDIISQGDLAISNHGDKTTMSFVVPPMGEIDFVPESQIANFKEQSKGLGRDKRRQMAKEAHRQGRLPKTFKG